MAPEKNSLPTRAAATSPPRRLPRPAAPGATRPGGFSARRPAASPRQGRATTDDACVSQRLAYTDERISGSANACS
eukprot:4897800-Alexandrium_andersonii.AAC.1